MRWILVRLLVLAALAGAWYPLDRWFADRERAAAAPVEFRFTLPFEDWVFRKYGFTNTAAVAEVFLTGRHADWHTDNTNFRMRPAGPGAWSLALAFRPGRHPYKFVVHLADKSKLPKWAGGIVWCHDKAARANEDDHYGGQNSLLEVEDAGRSRLLLRIAAAAAATLVLLHAFLVAGVRLLLRLRLSLRWKLAAVFAALLALAFAAPQVLAERQKRQFALRAATDKINMLHAFILGGGGRFDRPLGADREALGRIRRALDSFFAHSTVRYDFNVFSNTAQQVDAVFLLAPDGRLLDYALDRSAAGYIYAHHDGKKGRVDAYYATHVARLFAAYRAAAPPGRLADPWTAYWDDYLDDAERGDGSGVEDHARKTAGFRHDMFLMPVYADMALRGYYLVGMNPESYAAEFAGHRGFALALAGLVGLLFLLVVLDLGRRLLLPLAALRAWTEEVARGDVRPRADLAARRDLATGDEIGFLAGNFDRMRASLAAHLDGQAAIHALTGLLPRLRTEDGLHRALLAFLVAPFGFAFERAALFLRDADGDGTLTCRFAAGSPDVYGDGARRCATLDEFLAEPGRDAAEDPFAVAALGAAAPAAGAFVGAVMGTLRFAAGTLAEPAERGLADRLDLADFVLLPVRRGETRIGVLLVDRRYGVRPVTADETRRLEILLNEFAVALENAAVLATLEHQVQVRTAELTAALGRLSALAEAERFAAVGKLLAGVAHEVFNPLSAVRAPLDFLERDLARGGQADEATRAEAFRHAREGLARVERLVKGLRDLFSRREVRRERLELSEAVAPFVELARARAAAGVTVAVDIPAGLAVEAGRDALAHLVTNLLANAVDAVGGAGTVTLAARAAADGAVALSVADDGPGIAPEDLPRLFDAFWTTKDPGKGTGLGLFLVKDIALKYGWTVTADSPGSGAGGAAGRGAVFTVHFGGNDGR